MTLGGIVEVRGIATHPNLNFYQVRYAPGATVTAETQWVDFAIVQGSPVENGVLGSWDTTALPDGPYVMAIAVWGHSDGFPDYQFVQNLTVNNAQFVPSPVAETPTPEPLPTTAAGPSPTPVTIAQPATPTPRPTATAASLVTDEETPMAAPSAGLGLRLPLSFSDLREAFCTGGGIAVLLLLLWGLYLLLKAVVRYVLRQTRDPRVL
jgi:hypothetical protein